MSTLGVESGTTSPMRPYTQEDASASLVRAGRLVGLFAAAALPIAWWRGGWASAALLFVGAAISASGLWEWRRLMTALVARLEQSDAEQAGSPAFTRQVDEEPAQERKGPSIGFAVAGFIVRLFLVLVVLYVSLKHLHGSVLALAAGLAMGVVALTVEGVRLLRTGTI